jgi:hypothetical protein
MLCSLCSCVHLRMGTVVLAKSDVIAPSKQRLFLQFNPRRYCGGMADFTGAVRNVSS